RLAFGVFSNFPVTYLWEQSPAGEDDWSTVAQSNGKSDLDVTPSETTDYRCTASNGFGSPLVSNTITIAGASVLGLTDNDGNVADDDLAFDVEDASRFAVGDVIK